MKLLSPHEITSTALEAGRRKASLSASKLLIQSIQAGAFIGLGGILSLIVGFGFPELTSTNPSLQRLLSGLMFPIGLLLVVVLGAELFTGNNALLIPGFLNRSFGMKAIARNWIIVYIGNLIGAVAFAYFLVYAAGLTTAEPYHSAIVSMSTSKVSLPWLTIFVKAIGANWCVCLAVWLALSGHTLVDKMVGCFLPVMAFVILGYEHCVANMFFIPLGMMEGADITIGQFANANLVPATLGNIVGGAIFVGCVNSLVHISRQDNGKDDQ